MRENRTPGSVPGAPGNRRFYGDETTSDIWEALQNYIFLLKFPISTTPQAAGLQPSEGFAWVCGI